MMKNRISRRQALQGSAALAALGMAQRGAGAAEPRPAGWPFPQGVASGDPLHDRVILWTRLITPTNATERLEWQMSLDPAGRNIVRSGHVGANPRFAGVVKVDVDGLEPGTTYYYRFTAKGYHSPVGRTRTLPLGETDHIRLALCSCANYEGGYYNNYRAMANREDVDAVVHLGDYIYEYAPGVYGGHPDRLTSLPGESLTYGDYVARYAFYRSDPDLQAMHAAHPVIMVWDDHEIANDSWRGGAQNHDETEGDYLLRRQLAMRAWDEWMPVRAKTGEIYRSFAFGDLFHLIMIDARHEGRSQRYDYRDFIRQTENGVRFDASLFDRRIRGPERRIWSDKQVDWFGAALRKAARQRAQWVLIGNQMPVSPLTMPDLSALLAQEGAEVPAVLAEIEQLRQIAAAAGETNLPLNLDSWASFPSSQEKFLSTLAAAGPAPVVLTGDYHTSWAAELKTRGQGFGCEIGVPSISSPRSVGGTREEVEYLQNQFLAANPHLFFTELTQRGYVLLDINRDSASALWLYNPVDRPGVAETAGSYLEIPRHAPNKAQWRNLL